MISLQRVNYEQGVSYVSLESLISNLAQLVNWFFAEIFKAEAWNSKCEFLKF